MIARGGGKIGGEAMIDGIHAANSLTFRENTQKFFVLVGDEGPHGREFS